MNIGLPSPLLSRFDVVLLLRDSDDAGRDERLADHILHHNNRATGATTTTGAGPRAWSSDKLRSYFEYVKASLARPDGPSV